MLYLRAASIFGVVLIYFGQLDGRDCNHNYTNLIDAIINQVALLTPTNKELGLKITTLSPWALGICLPLPETHIPHIDLGAAYQGEYTMCASTASYRTRISGPM